MVTPYEFCNTCAQISLRMVETQWTENWTESVFVEKIIVIEHPKKM